MMMRFVVPAGAAALALMTTPVLAAGASTSGQMAAAQKQCAQLESTIDAQMAEATSTEAAKTARERQEGERLCNSGKPEEGVAMLQRALHDAMSRG